MAMDANEVQTRLRDWLETNVAGWSDARIVARAHAAGIDIALDRKGHTTGSRV